MFSLSEHQIEVLVSEHLENIIQCQSRYDNCMIARKIQTESLIQTTNMLVKVYHGYRRYVVHCKENDGG